MIRNIGKYLYDENRLLGVGGYGKVYEGINSETKEKVAVKIQSIKNIRKEIIDSIESEITYAKLLDHLNLIKCYDTFKEQDKYFMVMELCQTDLSNQLKNNQNEFDEENVFQIIQQILCGIKELRRLSLLHRDLKPANIFVLNNNIKIGDFGAIIEADYFGTKTIKQPHGTLHYKSPQILKNEKYTIKCDIWSLGIVCYELIYGQPPWISTSEIQLLRAIKSWPLRFSPQKIISQEFMDFITKCLQFQERDRMNWDDVFNHSWIINKQRTYKDQQDQLEQYEIQLINHIVEITKQQHLTCSQMFYNYDINNKGIIDLIKFELFIKHLDPRIIQKEIQNLFQYLDKESKNYLNYQQFEILFLLPDTP